MNDQLPELTFRNDGYFYDMVASFLVSLFACPAMFDPRNPLKLSPDGYMPLKGLATKDMHIRPFQIWKDVQKGYISEKIYLETCSAMLSNTAYESVKSLRNRSPEFEFFRHVRNA